MRARTLFVLLAGWLVLLSGCASEEADKLLGQWVGRPQLDQPTSHELAKVRIGLESIVLNFTSRRTVTMTVRIQGQPEAVQQGTWKLAETLGRRMTVELTLPTKDQPQPPPQRLLLVWDEAGRFTAREVTADLTPIDDRMPRLLFERAKTP